MSDLISREFLQTAIHNFFYGLNHTPTEEDIQRYIEVAPSVENKGEWIWQTEDIYKCSECGEDIHVKEVMNEPQYVCCPMCGARMKGGE